MLDLAAVVLDASASTADREPLSGHGFAGESGRRLLIVETPEVHLPKRG